jgi:exopolyphosphatase
LLLVSLHTYLSVARKNAAVAALVVLGNEAGDLDSMVSAIVYAFLCYQQDGYRSVLPVMPIQRADFSLRSEAVYLFQEAGIDPADIIFYDEIDLEALLAGGTELILVDHNELCSQLKQYNNTVVGILDHHVDAGLYPAAFRLIQAVGSTASLVALEFDRVGTVMDKKSAVLLCGTILLDTINLDPGAGRVTAVDHDMVKKLLPLCGISQQDFFKNIQRAKFKMSGLSTYDLLRKDYKEWQFGRVKCGVSTVLLSVADWLKMDIDLVRGFSGYMMDKNLDVLISMNGFMEDGFCRDLIIFCSTENEHKRLVSWLQEKGLELTAIPLRESLEGDDCMGFYHQGNVAVSRKKLQPLFAEFYGNRE